MHTYVKRWRIFLIWLRYPSLFQHILSLIKNVRPFSATSFQFLLAFICCQWGEPLINNRSVTSKTNLKIYIASTFLTGLIPHFTSWNWTLPPPTTNHYWVGWRSAQEEQRCHSPRTKMSSCPLIRLRTPTTVLIVVTTRATLSRLRLSCREWTSPTPAQTLLLLLALALAFALN